MRAPEGHVLPVVITHGTDTMQETAYLLDLLWDEAAPIVITGAMRSATAAGAQGPANLSAAVMTAVSPQSRGLGALTCLNDTVHLASPVQKTSPSGCAPLAHRHRSRAGMKQGRWTPTARTRQWASR